MFYHIKRWLCVTFAVVIAVACFLGLKIPFATRLSAISGERTYYLDTKSSCALRADELALKDVFRIKGECVRFSVEDENAETLAKTLHAEILFTERAGDSISYYAYSPNLGGGICVNGKLINLQIAFNGNACAVGTPLIFDGF